MRVCPNCGEENSDRAKFCQNCATALEEPAAPRETRKVVTVLFTDVTGSTTLGEQLDPESLRHVMGRFFGAMQAVVERHGGVVEKFIGDAVMAVFGIPRLHEDDPIRAVRAAREMRHVLQRLNEQLQAEQGVSLAVRSGVTTGEVVSGDPGTGQRLVTGDTVNTAARLEQAAAPGEILIGEPTYRLVRDAVIVEPAKALDLKGKAEPVPAYRLIEVTAGAEAHARRLDSPMVGRDRELRLLEEALDRARSEHTAHLFTLLGPAGVGKSRLVLEFLDRVAAEATILRGRCLSYGEGITFYPLSEVIHEAAQIAEDDSPEQARHRIEQAMPETHQAQTIAEGIADLIGVGDRPVVAEDANWAVRNFLESLARTRPLVVVFDDIHWAEPAFLDLVEHVADWSRDAPILLLCVARPELLDLRPGWGGGKMNATSILLEPLGPDDATRLIDNLLGTEGLAQQARTRILEAAEGNPLFVEEILGMLVDDGLLTREDGRWVASEEVERIAIPPTIQLLLAARLDRLNAEERAVAERASVEGKVFHRGAVMRLSPDRDRDQVGTRLLALTRKELIRPDRATFAGEDAFRFRHLLIRDAAYQGMSKEARAELHERFADWLAEQTGERLAEYEDILGYHLEQAYRFRKDLGPVDDTAEALGERAGTALSNAGRRAAERQDHHAAVGFLRRAVELTSRESPAWLERRYQLAEGLLDASELRPALELAEQVMLKARDAGDRKLEALTTNLHAWLTNMLDPTVTMHVVLERASEAMRTLEELGDLPGVMRVSRTVTFMKFALGKLDEAEGLIRRQLERARSVGSVVEIRDAARALAGNMVHGSTPAPEAIAEIEGLLPLVADSPASTAHLLQRLPVLHAMQGRFDDARRLADRAAEMLKDTGNLFELAGAVFWTKPVRMMAGEYEEAERELRESVALFERLGEMAFLSSVLIDLAEALMAQSKYDAAEELAERGRSMAAVDDIWSGIQWRAALAKVLAVRGEPEEAERLAREGVALADGTDYLLARGSVWRRLGEVLALGDKKEEAARAFATALDLYARKGDVVGAERARRELADLAGPASW